MAYTRDWDESQPTDSEYGYTTGGWFRKVKVDVAERLKNWIYGFISGETQEGLKKAPFVAQTSDPAAETEKGVLYVKEVNGVKELFYIDSSGNIKQLTSQGKLNLTDEGVVYTSGDQTISGVKTFNSSPKGPTPIEVDDLATKGYVDSSEKDEMVKATASDTSAGYLDSKVDATTIGVSGNVLILLDSSVSQVKLKTATGSGSLHIYTDYDGEEEGQSAVLPGGEYGFYPTTYYTKSVTGTSGSEYSIVMVDGVTVNTSYVPRITFLRFSDWGKRGDYYVYWKQRYVTASGYHHWIYLLLGKDNKIKGVWVAPDHPSANVPALPDEIPHPFSLDKGDKVVVVDESVMDEVKQVVMASKGRKTPAEVLATEFVLDDWERPNFKPIPIVKIDEWDAYEGERIAEIKVPQWCRVMFNNDKVCLKRIVVDKLPAGIEYRKMRKK